MVTGSARGRFAVVGVVALALVATGCQRDDDSSATTSIGDTTTTTAAATTTTPATTTAPTTEPTTTIVDTTTTAAATTTTSTTTTPDPTTTIGDTTTTAAATTTTDQAVPTTLVNVYWGWSVENPGAGSPERIGAGARVVAADVPVRNSLEAMFAGVDAVEREIGMTSSIPAGTRVLGIAVDGTTATVDLSSEFAAPGGTLDESMRLAQVVFAVTQFDGFDRVKFHLDGVPEETILSHGFVVGDGLTRDDFVDVRAKIMVEAPFPGAEVTSPLVISGESNTFESNVRYAIADGSGALVTEGFTTATAGMGTWGTFEIEVDLEPFAGLAGDASVIVWEDDPRTGDRVDIVEIPIVVTGA